MRLGGLSVLALVGLLALTGAASCADAADQPVPHGDGGDDGSTARGSGDGAAAVGPPAPPDAGGKASTAGGVLDPNYRYFARNFVMCTGQSLSIGYAGSPALSTDQPFDNEMFVGGVVPADTAEARASFVPLVEGPQVETMESGFANRTSELAEPLLVGEPVIHRSHRMLVSCDGIGGQPYSVLKKGTAAYQNGLSQLDAAVALSSVAGESLVVRGVTNVHGEADSAGGNTEYEANVVEWQHDVQADVQARTHQTLPVPMFHSQMSSFTRYGATFSAVTQAQLQAHVDQPGLQVLVGPKYMLQYADDGVHLTNESYRWMGEYYAKAYAREILEGVRWEPLRPLSATIDGAVITLELLVPKPPLVLDTTLVTNPGSYGFTFDDGSGNPPSILQVSLVDGTHVAVTLAAVPVGPAPEVSYAFQAVAGANAGPETGARGNVRDSDAAISSNGNPLYDWLVHFRMPVTSAQF